MANRAVLGKRTQPTKISDGTTTREVHAVYYNYYNAPGPNATITKTYVRLDSTVSFNSSANLTLTLPDGTTYVESNWTYNAGDISIYTVSGASGVALGPSIYLQGYTQTNYNSNPIVIGGPEARGAFVSGLDTSTGAGTSASPYGGANVIGVSNGALEATTFDSGSHIGGGLQVYKYYQGILHTNYNSYWNGNVGHAGININHNWGEEVGVSNTSILPAYALRFSRGNTRSMSFRPRVESKSTTSQVLQGNPGTYEIPTETGTIIEAGISNNSQANAAMHYTTNSSNTAETHNYMMGYQSWLSVDIKLKDFDLENTSAVAAQSNIISVLPNGYHGYVFYNTSETTGCSFSNAGWDRTGSVQGDILTFRVQVTHGGSSYGYFKLYFAFRRNNGVNGGAGDTAGMVAVQGYTYYSLSQAQSATTITGKQITYKMPISTYLPWKEESRQTVSGYNYSDTLRHFKFSANTTASNNNTLSLEAVTKNVVTTGVYGGTSSTTTGVYEHYYYGLVIFYEQNFNDGESI